MTYSSHYILAMWVRGPECCIHEHAVCYAKQINQMTQFLADETQCSAKTGIHKCSCVAAQTL